VTPFRNNSLYGNINEWQCLRWQRLRLHEQRILRLKPLTEAIDKSIAVGITRVTTGLLGGHDRPVVTVRIYVNKHIGRTSVSLGNRCLDDRYQLFFGLRLFGHCNLPMAWAHK
jgi:hypothetical protein